MTRLTWDDLLIEETAEAPERLLEEWRWVLGGEFRPLAWSKFGDCFIERRDGAIELLDFIEGNLQQVAASREEFHRLINTVEKQEEWLLSDLVYEMHQRGSVPRAGETYAFRIHPAIGGTIHADNVTILSHLVWSSLCGQLLRQIKEKPPGFRITEFKIKDQ